MLVHCCNHRAAPRDGLSSGPSGTPSKCRAQLDRGWRRTRRWGHGFGVIDALFKRKAELTHGFRDGVPTRLQGPFDARGDEPLLTSLYCVCEYHVDRYAAVVPPSGVHARGVIVLRGGLAWEAGTPPSAPGRVDRT
jgi:hypothetical protein